MTIASIEAEQSVLGAAMYAPEDCAEAFERLRPEHFYEPVHQRLWAAALAATRKGTVPDPVTLCGAMGADPAFAEMGGMDYLARLAEKATTWTIPAHTDAILDRSARRHIQALTREVQDRAGDTSQGDAEALLSDLERGASEIAREGSGKPQAVPVGLDALDMLEAAFAGQFVGTSVGLGVLDHVTGGVRQDDVWFIGGRTSMGKSVVGLALGRGLAEQGRGVIMFSLEMPKREVQARLIADIAYDLRIPENGQDGGNVRYGDLLKGRGTPQQKDRARDAAKQLASLPFTVNDAGGLTIEDIRSQALRQMRAWDKAGVPRGAIIIDHIGLVRPAKARSGDSKAAETADVVNELKGIAKQVGAPVIALCQVNRNTEARQDKRPTLADLNWSGAIEQIADFICLLYREAYYLERETERDFAAIERVRHELELLIHKNRSGPICNLKAFVSIASNVVRDPPTSMRAVG